MTLPYDQVLSWSVRQELLYGLLAITGDAGGELTCILIEFNTARVEIVMSTLVPLEMRVLGIDRRVAIRPARGGGEAPLIVPSKVYKFYNYLHGAILPGERSLRESDAPDGFGEEALAQAFWNDVVLDGMPGSEGAVPGTAARSNQV